VWQAAPRSEWTVPKDHVLNGVEYLLSSLASDRLRRDTEDHPTSATDLSRFQSEAIANEVQVLPAPRDRQRIIGVRGGSIS
jgi:hypothetical protein